MPVVTSIYRYPIKGLSAQPVSRVSLAAGRPFPYDRIFALARPNTPIDPRAPKWAKKGMFGMLMLDEMLAQVKTHLDIDTMRFTITQGNRQILCVNLDHEEDCAKVEEISIAWCRPCARRRGWCAPVAGILWTSPITWSHSLTWQH
jgi:GntR family transcriptional regulator/MocR family aminotransferase